MPADAPAGECRFALMLSGEPQAVEGAAVPSVSARLGIIVYLAIGDARPDFELVGAARVQVESVERPALRIRNTGLAHGRLEGMVDAVDAAGQRLVFHPSNLPILAGETRLVPLSPAPERGKPVEPQIRYPLTLKGRLDHGQSRLDIEGFQVP